jgi:hypothetical protein
MANYIGNSGEVQIGANAVAEVTAFSVSESANVADNTALGATWRTHKAGTKSWNGSVSCFYMEGDTNGQDAMTVGASVDLSLIPRGDTQTYIDLNGQATITSIETDVSLDGIITANFSFEGDGELAKDAIA